MAVLGGMIASGLISGLGQGISSGLMEQNRRQEWNRMFDFNQDKFQFQKDSFNQQLNQNRDLTMRGQNLNFGGSLLNTGMSTGASLIGNLLSYSHAQDTLNFQREQYSNQRSDLEREGLPLSYLHLGGMSRSVPNIPMMRTQTLGRSVSNPWGYANSGTNLRETYGPPPPSYFQSQRSVNRTTEDVNNSLGWQGLDPSSGFPK